MGDPPKVKYCLSTSLSAKILSAALNMVFFLMGLAFLKVDKTN